MHRDGSCLLRKGSVTMSACTFCPIVSTMCERACRFDSWACTLSGVALLTAQIGSGCGMQCSIGRRVRNKPKGSIRRLGIDLCVRTGTEVQEAEEGEANMSAHNGSCAAAVHNSVHERPCSILQLATVPMQAIAQLYHSVRVGKACVSCLQITGRPMRASLGNRSGRISAGLYTACTAAAIPEQFTATCASPHRILEKDSAHSQV